MYVHYVHMQIFWLIAGWIDRWMNGHDLAAHPTTYEYVQYSGCKGTPTYIIPQIWYIVIGNFDQNDIH